MTFDGGENSLSLTFQIVFLQMETINEIGNQELWCRFDYNCLDCFKQPGYAGKIPRPTCFITADKEIKSHVADVPTKSVPYVY